MDRAALAAWVAGLDPAQRVELAATVRAGVHALQTVRPRNGTRYDPTAAHAVLSALTAPPPNGGQRRPALRQLGGEWLTVEQSAARAGGLPGLSGRTVRRWASSGRVRARKAHSRTWLVYQPDVERELRRRREEISP